MTARKTPLDIGEELPQEELKELNLFPGEEGMIQLVYGRIRNGKSTYAARLMYNDLFRGIPVYSNLDLDLAETEFDERRVLSISLENLLFGKKVFYRFRTENFHYFNPTTGEMRTGDKWEKVFDPTIPGDEVRWLNTLTDCSLYYDEGHWLLNSYEATRIDLGKRRLTTETGHMNRKIVIISQRTQAIHVDARANVNQFFRCSKQTFFIFFMRLQVEEFQDMKGNDVDESDESRIATRIYWSNDKYWRLFNTHALRQGKPKSQEVYFNAYWVGFFGRIRLVLMNLFGRGKGAPLQGVPLPTEEAEHAVQAKIEPSGHLSKLSRKNFDIPTSIESTTLT